MQTAPLARVTARIRRSRSASESTTARQLWIGFGTLTAMLVVSTVVILVRVRSLEGQLIGIPNETHREAALHDVQAIVAFAALLLAVSAVIAVVMSGAIGSGIVGAEKKLWASREQLRVTLASIGDAVITTDAEGNVTYLNPVAEELTGWTQDSATDRSLAAVFKIVHQRTRLPVECPIRSVLKSGHVITLANHTMLISRDGTERPIDDSAAPIRDNEGRMVGVVLVFHDITERRRTEGALRKSEGELADALREAARHKDEFLATLAHELRGPLSPLRNSLELMRRAGGDGHTLLQARNTMERQLAHLVRLVDDLLDVSRITRGKLDLRKTRVDLASVIAQAVETCSPAIESLGHHLEVVLPRGAVYLDADPIRLAQVLSNLLNNACKYSEPGSRISLLAEQQGSDAVVTVKDTGIGIPAELLPRIFDLFMQADHSLERAQGGLGIGLTLVQRFVEMHGGSVSASSAGLDQGSEFVVRLPVLLGAGPPLPDPINGTATPATPAPSRRILVVDDNRDSASALAMVLKLDGHQTHTAHDGLEAVAAAAALRPEVVLLDIGLPKLNGYEAARRMREQPWGKTIVLVALTGWGQEEDRRKSGEAGFNAHLVKPVDCNALTKLLAELSPVEAR